MLWSNVVRLLIEYIISLAAVIGGNEENDTDLILSVASEVFAVA